jgi:hypothetical protein
MDNVRDPATKDVIRLVGSRSIVLLKNSANALPLRNPKNIGVYGLNAINSGSGPTYLEDASLPFPQSLASRPWNHQWSNVSIMPTLSVAISDLKDLVSRSNACAGRK